MDLPFKYVFRLMFNFSVCTKLYFVDCYQPRQQEMTPEEGSLEMHPAAKV